MRVFPLLMGVAAAGWIAAPSQAQMGHMGEMGGARFMVNVVSPMTSPIQIGRGVLMINRGMMAGMSGSGGMPMMTPGPGSQGLQIRLFLSGVTDAGTLVTSNDNHLQISGTLTSSDGSNHGIDVDAPFNLTNGTGFFFLPFSLPDVAAPAVLEINKVGIVDAAGNSFGVAGLRTSAPVLSPTPGMMPGMSPTPGMMPRMSPTPGMMGGMTPHMTPGLTMTPRMSPDPTMTPGMMGSMTPHMTPGLTMTPRMNPDPTMTPGMGTGMTPRPAATPSVTRGMGHGMGVGGF